MATVTLAAIHEIASRFMLLGNITRRCTFFGKKVIHLADQ
jgi:hypothetical protein